MASYGTTVLVDLEDKCELSLTSSDSLRRYVAGRVRAEGERRPTTALTHRASARGVSGGIKLRRWLPPLDGERRVIARGYSSKGVMDRSLPCLP